MVTPAGSGENTSSDVEAPVSETLLDGLRIFFRPISQSGWRLISNFEFQSLDNVRYGFWLEFFLRLFSPLSADKKFICRESAQMNLMSMTAASNEGYADYY